MAVIWDGQAAHEDLYRKIARLAFKDFNDFVLRPEAGSPIWEQVTKFIAGLNLQVAFRTVFQCPFPMEFNGFQWVSMGFVLRLETWGHIWEQRIKSLSFVH